MRGVTFPPARFKRTRPNFAHGRGVSPGAAESFRQLFAGTRRAPSASQRFSCNVTLGLPMLSCVRRFLRDLASPSGCSASRSAVATGEQHWECRQWRRLRAAGAPGDEAPPACDGRVNRAVCGFVAGDYFRADGAGCIPGSNPAYVSEGPCPAPGEQRRLPTTTDKTTRLAALISRVRDRADRRVDVRSEGATAGGGPPVGSSRLERGGSSNR